MNRSFLVIASALVLIGNANLSFAQDLNAPSSISSQELLPASTKAWLSIPDAKNLDKKFLETQIGQLCQEEEFAPFIESVKGQFRQWMSDKNVRLGLNLEDVQDIRSGEICLAGILPAENGAANKNAKPLGKGVHGVVLLVDVNENIAAANELMKQLGENLIARGASKEPYEDLYDAKVSKWKFPQKGRLKKPRFAYQAIVGGWLLSSDNESIFRRIARRLSNIDGLDAGQTLAAQKSFQRVLKKTATEEIEPQVQWYINPFGYFQLAQAIAAEDREFKQTNSDDWAGVLKKIGFDGFQGVGGNISFATGDHEILHKTYVYKPAADDNNVKQQQVFGLFDFENNKQSPLTPPKFVSSAVSSFFTGTWNMQLALENVGHAIDTFARSEGMFEEVLESLKLDLNVDVPTVVSKFDNEFFVLSDTEMPIQEDSERLVIAVKHKVDSEYIIKNIKKSWPGQFRETEFKAFKIVEID
ncbi:MAG: hypothetical protein AAGA30_18715, partial [Planctomycetota bacterium]